VRAKLAIGKGDRVVIPAGTHIAFGPEGRIEVLGELWVLGTSKAPVVLDGIEGGSWGGIKVIRPGAFVAFFHAELRGGAEPPPAAPQVKDLREVGLWLVGGARGYLADSRLTGWTGGAKRDGGALLVESSRLTGDEPVSRLELVACTIEGNRSDRGGGLEVRSGSRARLRRCIVRGNQGVSGGAVFVHDADLSSLDTTFSQNQAEKRGGAIAVRLRSHVRLRGGLFEQNQCGGSGGGAVYVSAGGGNRFPAHLTCEGVRFVRNRSKIAGGAVDGRDRGEATFTGCTFAGNEADQIGGALNVVGQAHARLILSLEGCRFSGNRAPVGGDVAIGGPPVVREEQLEACGLSGPPRVQHYQP
jgi:predicted outer membrane repeat protein